MKFLKKVGKALKKVSKVALPIASLVANAIPVVGGAVSKGLSKANSLINATKPAAQALGGLTNGINQQSPIGGLQSSLQDSVISNSSLNASGPSASANDKTVKTIGIIGGIGLGVLALKSFFGGR